MTPEFIIALLLAFFAGGTVGAGTVAIFAAGKGGDRE
jgi:hypothetical protein